jgi:hypothetical protein
LPDSWVFTNEGPKKIKDVLAGDMVFGKDGQLHKVLSTRSKIYSGLIYNVRHTGTHLSCWSTNDHLWLVARQKDKRKSPKGEWIKASDLCSKKHDKVGDYLSFPTKFEDSCEVLKLNVRDYVKGEVIGDRLQPFTSAAPQGKQVHSIPLEWDINDDFLFMIGIYLAEGSASIQSAYFCMNQNERRHLERIEAYLLSLGIPSHYQKDRQNLLLRIDSCLFARFISKMCGKLSTEKAINEKLFSQLSHASKMKVYKAWDIGDGRKCRENEFSTTTVSEKLTVQMMFIALANGYFPRCYKSNSSKRGTVCHDIHLFPSNFLQAKK